MRRFSFTFLSRVIIISIKLSINSDIWVISELVFPNCFSPGELVRFSCFFFINFTLYHGHCEYVVDIRFFHIPLKTLTLDLCVLANISGLDLYWKLCGKWYLK